MSQNKEASRLLIVDDDPAIRSLFSTIIGLSLPDLTVDTAVNGADAVDDFNRQHPQVVIMDLHMPLMDGVQAYEAMEDACRKESRRLPSVIFCTGFTVPEVVNDMIEQNPNLSLLHKPVRATDLVARVREQFEPAP